MNTKISLTALWYLYWIRQDTKKDMKTEMKGNVISFLVGTVNSETYKEDEYISFLND